MPIPRSVPRNRQFLLITLNAGKDSTVSGVFAVISIFSQKEKNSLTYVRGKSLTLKKRNCSGGNCTPNIFMLNCFPPTLFHSYLNNFSDEGLIFYFEFILFFKYILIYNLYSNLFFKFSNLFTWNCYPNLFPSNDLGWNYPQDTDRECEQLSNEIFPKDFIFLHLECHGQCLNANIWVIFYHSNFLCWRSKRKFTSVLWEFDCKKRELKMGIFSLK